MGIRDLRKQAGLTQQELADKVTAAGYHLSRQTVSDIENDKTRPTARLTALMRTVLEKEIHSQFQEYVTSDIKNRGVSPEAACKKYEDAGKLPVHRSAAALARKEDDAVVLTLDPALCHGGDMLGEPSPAWQTVTNDTIGLITYSGQQMTKDMAARCGMEEPIAAVERQPQERYPERKKHLPRIAVPPRKSLWAQFCEWVRG